MQTENIERFLQTAFTDERLAGLLAHCEDGKLVFYSCCCFAGAPTADHALRGEIEDYDLEPHYIAAKKLPFAAEAEREFCSLAYSFASDRERDSQRRAIVKPLILAEIERRDKLRTSSPPSFSESFPQQQVGVV